MEIKEGNKAPEFCLRDQNDKEVCLRDFAGKWVVLYFYPKDDTPGCTKEACSFRDNMVEFGKLKIKVLGISKDTVKSHKKFEEKYGLNFPLLADTETEVNQKYGVWRKKKFMGREYMGTARKTFVIDPEGLVKKIFEDVKPEGHAEEVVKEINES